MILLFLFGEEFNPGKIAAREGVGLFFFPFGIVVGMIIAWWHEGIGGTISVISLLGFYFIYGLFMNNRVWQGGWFIVFTIPGILFFIYWLIFHYTIDRVVKN